MEKVAYQPQQPYQPYSTISGNYSLFSASHYFSHRFGVQPSVYRPVRLLYKDTCLGKLEKNFKCIFEATVPFKTKDEFEIVLAVGNDKQFSNLCKVLECAHLSQDEKFKTNPSRVINRAVLNMLLATQIKTFNQSGLLSQLEQHQVPAGAINSVKEVFELPQTKSLLFHANGIRGLKTFIAKGIETETSLTPPPHLDADTNKVLGL